MKLQCFSILFVKLERIKLRKKRCDTSLRDPVSHGYETGVNKVREFELQPAQYISCEVILPQMMKSENFLYIYLYQFHLCSHAGLSQVGIAYFFPYLNYHSMFYFIFISLLLLQALGFLILSISANQICLYLSFFL